MQTAGDLGEPLGLLSASDFDGKALHVQPFKSKAKRTQAQEDFPWFVKTEWTNKVEWWQNWREPVVADPRDKSMYDHSWCLEWMHISINTTMKFGNQWLLFESTKSQLETELKPLDINVNLICSKDRTNRFEGEFVSLSAVGLAATCSAIRKSQKVLSIKTAAKQAYIQRVV